MRRVALTLIGIGVFSLYVISNQLMVGRPAPTLETSLDRAIPFWPWAEVIYLSVYLFLFLPVAAIRHPRVFERTAYAFYTFNLVALAIFWVFPVRYERPPVFELDTLWKWGVAFNYAYDPPYNNFPSLHVANAIFASLVALRVDRPVGVIALVLALAISVSTLLVKQHWLADVAAGAALGYVSYQLIVAPAIPEGATREELAYPRKWTALLAIIYGFVFLAFVAMYELGMQPFPWPKGR